MKAIYEARRHRLMENKSENSVVVIFSGIAPMKSQDEAYPFAADRNFFYLTGIERENMILVMRKNYLGEYAETLYIEPYDELLAKWVGGRMRPAEATEISGIADIANVETFPDRLNGMVEYSRHSERPIGLILRYSDTSMRGGCRSLRYLRYWMLMCHPETVSRNL